MEGFEAAIIDFLLALVGYWEGLGLKPVILFGFKTDFGGLEAEIFDVNFGFGMIWEGLRLKYCILHWFWKDFEGSWPEHKSGSQLSLMIFGRSLDILGGGTKPNPHSLRLFLEGF